MYVNSVCIFKVEGGGSVEGRFHRAGRLGGEGTLGWGRVGEGGTWPSKATCTGQSKNGQLSAQLLEISNETRSLDLWKGQKISFVLCLQVNV